MAGQEVAVMGMAAWICTTCGTPGNPKRVTKGSILIEIVLWMCFFIPGVIYSIWRLTTRYDACPSCGGGTMIPAGSPAGRKLAGEMIKQG